MPLELGSLLRNYLRGIAVVGSSALLLTGCAETYGLGPTAISSEGANFSIAICQDVEVDPIYGEVRRNDGTWSPFIDLKGHAALKTGTVLNSSIPVAGMTGKFEPIQSETVTAVAIKVEGPGDGATSFTSTYSSRSALTIPSNSWLRTDSAVTPAPCGK